MPKPFIERKNNAILDVIELQKEGYTDIHFQGVHLLGGSECNKPYNECFFGELDSKDNNLGLDTLKPIYHLIGEIDYDSKDSKESFTQTLQVFLDSNTLTLLNYSLLDSSLNIKLECNSSESKAIQEREKEQRKQQKQQDSQTQDSSLITSNDDSLSTSMLHPILEDNEIKCPHNGVVRLKANKGNSFTSKGIPLVLESDLLNAPIIGYTNNIAGIPTPCTSVSVILPSARGLKKFNDDYPIMQDLVASGVLSDKGFPLICTPKENTFRINSPNPSNANTQSKEALSSQIDITIPSLTLITPYRDLEEYYFTPSFYENRESKEYSIISQSGFYTTDDILDITLPDDILDITLPPLLQDRDYAPLDSNPTLTPLLQDISTLYTPTFFSYRILSLRVAYSIYEYLLLIPKTIPRYITKLLKEKREKQEMQYGYGRFIDLQREYIRDIDRTQDEIPLLHIQGKVLLAPSGCERVRVSVV